MYDSSANMTQTQDSIRNVDNTVYSYLSDRFFGDIFNVRKLLEGRFGCEPVKSLDDIKDEIRRKGSAKLAVVYVDVSRELKTGIYHALTSGAMPPEIKLDDADLQFYYAEIRNMEKAGNSRKRGEKTETEKSQAQTEPKSRKSPAIDFGIFSAELASGFPAIHYHVDLKKDHEMRQKYMFTRNDIYVDTLLQEGEVGMPEYFLKNGFVYFASEDFGRYSEDVIRYQKPLIEKRIFMTTSGHIQSFEKNFALKKAKKPSTQVVEWLKRTASRRAQAETDYAVRRHVHLEKTEKTPLST
jgi:hypothetical protein